MYVHHFVIGYLLHFDAQFFVNCFLFIAEKWSVFRCFFSHNKRCTLTLVPSNRFRFSTAMADISSQILSLGDQKLYLLSRCSAQAACHCWWSKKKTFVLNGSSLRVCDVRKVGSSVGRKIGKVKASESSWSLREFWNLCGEFQGGFFAMAANLCTWYVSQKVKEVECSCRCQKNDI